jgi:hypothetical protein
MSRSPTQRLHDILLACDMIDEHLRRGPADQPLNDGLIFDAVRVRLMEIGEAVKDLPSEVTAAEPGPARRAAARPAEPDGPQCRIGVGVFVEVVNVRPQPQEMIRPCNTWFP